MKLPLPWRNTNHDRQPARQPTVELAHAGEVIARTQAGAQVGEEAGGLPASPNAYADQWAEIVLRFSNIELLTGHQNSVIFGARATGRVEVMRRITNLMNVRFNAEHHAALYAPIEQLVTASTIYNFTSVDALYRSLISAPLTWATQHLHVKEDREFHKTAAQLKALLNVPVAQLDMLAIRDTLLRWLDRMGIQHFSFVVDDLSSLAAEFIPVLLQMLLDTFPRGGRVSFKIGGTKQALKLHERSKNGAVGMQISHDILVGLDLEQVLYASDLSASQFDPRQVFLLDCIQSLAPEQAAHVKETPDPAWGALFDPPDAWYTLFQGVDGDIALVGAALEHLLPALNNAPTAKADAARIEQAINQAKVQAGLRKPAAQPR